ncbi:MAG: hypothetical protein VX726_07970 [Planctomycetota bacterium]|nr:hypothetical protein [Planctomycetota bacterium]
MRVLIDDSPCDTEATTIGEAVAAAAEAAERAGRLVCEVLVDGALLSEEELQQSATLARAASEVQLVTTTMDALLKDVFVPAAEALSETAVAQQEAAELIQSGRIAEGMNSLRGVMETWVSIREAVEKGLVLADLEAEDLVVDGIALPEAIGRLGVRLGGLKSAIANEDVSATCDCLLYDLPESTREWTTVLHGLATRYTSED